MKEYIERAQLLKNLGYDETRRADVLPGSTFDIVLKEPTADVEEVRHGRWIVHFDHFTPYQKCSVCGFEIPLVVATENEAEICLYKHCPECIARMDKEDEHETD